MKFDLKPETINYIKILYKDSNDFSHCVKASIKYFTEYDIYACVKKEEWEGVPSPQEVTLNFACNNGLYRAKSTLKYTKYEEPYLYFSIRIPDELEYQQNREYFRVHIDKDVVISYRTEDEVRRVACKTLDLSANGLKVRLSGETFFPEDVFVDIYFENREIRTKAKYVRSDEEDEIIKASFHFVDLQPSDLDYISRTCIKKQIEDKRSSLE